MFLNQTDSEFTSSSGSNGTSSVQSAPQELNNVRPVYPYAPLVSSLDQWEAPETAATQAKSAVETSADDVRAINAKCGFRGLQYKDPTTAQEFLRYCHRGVEVVPTAAAFLMPTVTSMISSQGATPLLIGVAVCIVGSLLFDMSLHYRARHPERFTAEIARLRHLTHISIGVAAMLGQWNSRAVQLDCPVDPTYAKIHGQDASSLTRYYSCARTIRIDTFCIALVVLRPDIHCHCLLTTLHLALQTFGLFFVEAPEFEGVHWEDSLQERLVRVAVVIMMTQLSNLVAWGHHRMVQRQFEAAVDLHYQMRVSHSHLGTVDSLLCSLVPPSTLERVINKDKVLDETPSATVLFADMVHFTCWSSTRTPPQITSMLSIVMSGIDALAVQRGVTKVKTIGDCYWAVAGLPDDCPKHAEVMIHFGLALLEHIETEATEHMEWNAGGESKTHEPVQFRVGIHSGPLSGGVLGTQQISYEVFGETSTIANEVEQRGIPMRVVVTSATMQQCVDGREKDQGELPFYFELHNKAPSGGGIADVVDVIDLDVKEIDEEECEAGKDNPAEDSRGVLLELDEIALAKETEKVEAYAKSIHRRADMFPKLFFVTLKKSLVEETTSQNAKSIPDQDHSVVKPYGRPKLSAVDRERFVQSQLMKNRGVTDQLLGIAAKTSSPKHGGSADSTQQPQERYTLNKTRCSQRTFEDPQAETELTKFVLNDFASVRLGARVILTTLHLLLTILFFVDCSQEIPLSTSTLLILGLLLCCWATKMEASGEGANPSEESDEEPTRGYNEFFILVVGINIWLLTATYLTPDSIITNDVTYCYPATLLLLLALPNLHIPTIPLVAVFQVTLTGGLINAALRSHNPSMVIRTGIMSSIFPAFLILVLKSRLRVQFLDGKKAIGYMDQQETAMKAQETVLGSMVPDFVIAPLCTWLSSKFDPEKAVAQSHPEVCVAFLRMTPNDTPWRVQSGLLGLDSGGRGGSNNHSKPHAMDWLYKGHQEVDKVLRHSPIVDKVKTVGDLVIIAGSFRGHSSRDASEELLAVAVEIHTRFSDRTPSGGAHPSAATIGLHAGPVMSTVLSYSRPAFDIFGDTVNTASRVMTCGVGVEGITASNVFLKLVASKKNRKVRIRCGPPCSTQQGKGEGTLLVREIFHD